MKGALLGLLLFALGVGSGWWWASRTAAQAAEEAAQALHAAEVVADSATAAYERERAVTAALGDSLRGLAGRLRFTRPPSPPPSRGVPGPEAAPAVRLPPETVWVAGDTTPHPVPGALVRAYQGCLRVEASCTLALAHADSALAAKDSALALATRHGAARERRGLKKGAAGASLVALVLYILTR